MPFQFPTDITTPTVILDANNKNQLAIVGTYLHAGQRVILVDPNQAVGGRLSSPDTEIPGDTTSPIKSA